MLSAISLRFGQIEMSWMTVDLGATGGRQIRKQAVYAAAEGTSEQMSEITLKMRKKTGASPKSKRVLFF